jgi:tetratricopeptide (TPR) repeat protein
MARLSSEALTDDNRAADLWGRVLDIRGEDPLALSALSELCQRPRAASGTSWSRSSSVRSRSRRAIRTRSGPVQEPRPSGSTSSSASATPLDAWLAADRIDGHDLETLRSLAHLYRSTQAWDELSQTLRRIIDVGNLNGEVSENETIELYAQLGQLEGEVLGRVDDAVEAWRRVVSIDPSDFRALAALEGLFTREGRWEEAIDVLEKRALVLDDRSTSDRETLLQAAATWEEKVEDLDHAGRGLRAGPRDRQHVNAIGVRPARSDLHAAQHKWTELNEVLVEQVSQLRPTSRSRSRSSVRSRRSTRPSSATSDNAYVRPRRPRSSATTRTTSRRELERLATATNRWQELLDEYTNRVNELEREDRGSAADLWVKIGRWYAEHLSHLEYAIHSVQQALRIDPAHTGALGGMADLQRKRGSWTELSETLSAPRCGRDRQGPEDRPLHLARRAPRAADAGSRWAIHAYQQALNYSPASPAALVALDRLYRPPSSGSR